MFLLIISEEKKQQPLSLLSSPKNFGNPPLSLSKKLEIPPQKKKIPQSLTLFQFLFVFFANPWPRATSAEAASRLQMRFRPANVPSGEDRVAWDQPGTRLRSGGKGQKRGEKVVRQLKKNRYRGCFMIGVHFGE